MGLSYSFTPSWPLVAPKINEAYSVPQSQISNLIKINIYPQWYHQISLDWTIPAEWGNCTFNVYSTPGPEEEFQRLTPTPISDNKIVNTGSNTYTKLRNEFYVVEAVLPDGTSYQSPLTTWSYQVRSKTAKIASEVQRREYLLLTKFAGVKSFFFKKRYYGIRCHRCWNPTLEKVMDDNCPVCVGTSWEGGYFNPVPCFIQFDPTPNDIVETPVGLIEPNQLQAWTISLPSMTDGDVIIRSGDWNAYKIVQIRNTELQTNPIKQTLKLTQLGKKYIENVLVSRIIDDDAGRYLDALGGDYSTQRFPRALVTSTRSDDPAWAQNQNIESLPQKYVV